VAGLGFWGLGVGLGRLTFLEGKGEGVGTGFRGCDCWCPAWSLERFGGRVAGVVFVPNLAGAERHGRRSEFVSQVSVGRVSG